MQSLHTRLATVEHKLRIQRGLIALLLVVLVALVGFGASHGVPDVIRAKRFIVVNEDGNEVVELKSWKFGGYIATYQATGNRKFSTRLAHTFDGNGLLAVSNLNGREVVYVGADPSGNGSLRIFNNKSRDLVIAGVNTSGEGTVWMYNKAGTLAMLLQSMNFHGGGGGIRIYNKSKQNVVEIYSDKNGKGQVNTDPGRGGK